MITYRQPFRGEYPITQRYGEVIPGVTVNGKPHTGIDYGCPMGTPILASAGGTVMAAGWDQTGYGFRVIVRHEDGLATLYAHLYTIDVSVRDEVRQGQEIGTSGATGGSKDFPVTGPHLHFEVRTRWNDYSSHFDPMALPLMTVDDSVVSDQQPVSEEHQQEPIGAGWVRVVCDLPANVRDPWIHSRIIGQKHKGDAFLITEGTMMINDLPYHRIQPRYVDELGGLIAEYDSFGTQILEAYGKQEE